MLLYLLQAVLLGFMLTSIDLFERLKNFVLSLLFQPWIGYCTLTALMVDFWVEWMLICWILVIAVYDCCWLELLKLLWIIVAHLNGWYCCELLLLGWMVWMGVAGLNGLNGSCWVEWLFMVHIRVANGYASQELWFVLCVWFLFKLHCHSKTFSLAANKYCKHSHVYCKLFWEGFVAVLHCQVKCIEFRRLVIHLRAAVLLIKLHLYVL